ncbi:acrosin [Xenopus laevis]|nr:acrosin [Xenopus laevis]XP_041445882.1 acrosin [Xenopus laevis]XP_041445883.1 acrosin [Xenopus laevis]
MMFCNVAGWKALDGSESATIQLQSDTDFVPTDVCNGKLHYKGKLPKNTLCARDISVDTCIGDLGGPLICQRKLSYSYIVVGVKSWTNGCPTRAHPRVFTATQAFTEWIDRKIYGSKSKYAIADALGKKNRTKRSLLARILLSELPTAPGRVTPCPSEATPFRQTKSLKLYLANLRKPKAATQVLSSTSTGTPLNEQLPLDTNPAQDAQVTPEPKRVDLLQSIGTSLMKIHRGINEYIRGFSNGHEADFS